MLVGAISKQLYIFELILLCCRTFSCCFSKVENITEDLVPYFITEQKNNHTL